MDKVILNHLKNSLTNPRTRRRLRRPFMRPFQSRGHTRFRPLQFLRPLLYCYAYPDYFSTMPASQPHTEYVTARIVNAGGVPSTNTIVHVVEYGPYGNHNSYKNTFRLQLQAGQGHTERIGFSAMEKVHFFQLACYDPLHDPVTPLMLQQMLSVTRASILTNATDPQEGTDYKIAGWDESTQQADGSWQPAGAPTWLVRKDNPKPGTISLAGNESYFATSNSTPAASQLRQTIPLASLNLATSINSCLTAGNLRAHLDGLIYLKGPSGSSGGHIEIEFLAADGSLLHTFTSPSPTQHNAWVRLNASIAIPSATTQIICKLVAFRFTSGSGRNFFLISMFPTVFFDELYLRLTPRNIFTSGRIYSF